VSALAIRKREPPPIAGRVPPHDLDAEAAVLSAVLLSRAALDRVLEVLKPQHFYSDANGRIFEASEELAVAGTPTDIVSVASWLRDRDRLAQVGGAAYLAQLADATPAVAHIEAHAQIVYQKWRVRQLIDVCQRIAAEGYGDTGEEDVFLVESEARVHDVAHNEHRQSAQHIQAVLLSAMSSIRDDCDPARGTRIQGVQTGYERLDQKLCGGFRDGDLYVIAGRPGMGKTGFVMNVAVNAAAPRTVDERYVYGDGVAVFSLEMPREQLVERMLAGEARVDFGRLRGRKLQPADWPAITEASQFLAGLPIWIDDTPALSLMELRAKIRNVQSQWERQGSTADERRVRLVIVDYLQLMRGREGAKSREQEISEISRGLKELAKTLKVPIVVLSQLNRSTENRSTKDKRPQLSDLRESGAIEQDADAVMLLYRDDYYFPETTNANGIAELIIAKQRNGPTGKVLLRFSAACTRFDNLHPGDYPEMHDND